MGRLLINILFAILILAAPSASAQDAREIVGLVKKHSAQNRVLVRYVFSAQIDDVTIEDEGYVEAQDDMWHLKGKAYEVYTDKDATWVLDLSAKEAIVEPAWTYDDLEKFYDSLLSSGSVLDIEVQPAELTDKQPSESYTPVLGDEWIVTDLR